jgi:hypothetical protein
MNQILQAYNTRCILKPLCEIIISLLMKFQDDQRCVIKCQFHESFQFLHPMLLCLTHSLFKLKPKINLYPSMFCPNKFNCHFLFGYIFPILISLLVVLSTFKYWSMLLAIMRTTQRMKIFILGIKFWIQKSTLIIYQKVIKLGIWKPTLTHDIYVLSTK